MRRYYHYMQSASGGRWPKQVLCLAPSKEQLDRTNVNGKCESQFCTFEIVCLVRSKGKYEQITHSINIPRKLVWNVLYAHTQAFSPTWILSSNTLRLWHTLDLWEELEHGRLSTTPILRTTERKAFPSVHTVPSPLPSIGESRQSGSMCGMRGNSQGFIISGSPPTLARLYVASTGKWILWTDALNYGVSEPPLANCESGLAMWLATLFQRLATTSKHFGLGSLRLTAGSQALHTFKKIREPVPLYCHTDSRVIPLEQEASYGGRCECFEIGNIGNSAYHLDVRSMYAYVMRENYFPTVLEKYWKEGEVVPLTIANYSYCAIARVLIQTDKPLYPYRRTNDTIWPIGTFWTTLAGPELTLASKLGHIQECTDMATYRMDKIFHTYVDTIYGIRESAEATKLPDIAKYAKALLVALPGKLGQRNMGWVNASHVWTTQQWGEWWGSDETGTPQLYRALGGVVERWEDTGYAYDAVPAVAAYVTAYARMRLLHFIEKAYWRNVYYCDTDSLICNLDAYVQLFNDIDVCELRLGNLYIKNSLQPTVIHGLKHYQEGERLVCAGKPRTVVVDVNGELLLRKQCGVDEALHKGMKPHMQFTDSPYTAEGYYRHGNVQPNGRVLPIVLNER